MKSKNRLNNTLVMDLVSVIIPIYNSSSYLHRCIESILKQSYRDIEVILVDDGSTDGSGEICDKYARDDSRVRVFHTINCGASSARNMGICNSNGSFILFVDSDDFIETYAVHLLMEGYKQSHVDMVGGSFNKIKDGNVIAEVRDFKTSQLLTKRELADYTMSYLHNPRQNQLLMSSWAKLFRSAIIKNNNILFNTELRTFEDVAFNFDYLKNAENVYFLNEVIYNQQKYGTYTSLTMRMPEDEPQKMFSGMISALGSIEDFLRPKIPNIKIDTAIGHYYIYQIILFVIRVCGQIKHSNIKRVYRFIHELINGPDFRHRIKHYAPAKGNYRLIPFVMKLRLVWLVIGVCWYEAYRLYGNRRDAKCPPLAN